MIQRDSCAPLLIRLGLAAVFILFGFDKLVHPETWIVFYPPRVHQVVPLPPYEFLKFQGIAEILLGTALGLGFMTRISAFLAACILGLIIFFLWLDPLAIRDIGLFCASLALVISGGGNWSLDRLFKHRNPA